MSKESRFKKYIDKQHGERAQTVLQSSSEYFIIFIDNCQDKYVRKSLSY